MVTLFKNGLFSAVFEFFIRFVSIGYEHENPEGQKRYTNVIRDSIFGLESKSSGTKNTPWCLKTSGTILKLESKSSGSQTCNSDEIFQEWAT